MKKRKVMFFMNIHEQTIYKLAPASNGRNESDLGQCVVSSSGRVRVGGGHAATKHQLAKTSGSLYCVQRDCATLIIL